MLILFAFFFYSCIEKAFVYIHSMANLQPNSLTMATMIFSAGFRFVICSYWFIQPIFMLISLLDDPFFTGANQSNFDFTQSNINSTNDNIFVFNCNLFNEYFEFLLAIYTKHCIYRILTRILTCYSSLL